MQFVVGGVVDAVGSVLFEDGRVTALYLVRNPDKLTRVGEAVTLTRSTLSGSTLSGRRSP